MLYKIYDLPTWMFGVLTVVFFAMVACGGLMLTRAWIRTHLRLASDTNDSVNAYFAGVGVFYGLLLGLVAVATWQNYDAASSLISKEAARVGALYRDVSSYPDPIKSELQRQLQNYVADVIDNDWPAQQHGRALTGGTHILSEFQNRLMSFEPAPGGQTILHAETFRAFNNLIEARRLRLDAVTAGLPAVLWGVVLIGAVLSVFITYFFHIGDQKLHLILTGTLGIFIGLMVFLTAAVDNPFRGQVSVSSDSYRLVLEGLMDLKPLPNQDTLKH
jgi:Protein of unknown function (DUF4239)